MPRLLLTGATAVCIALTLASAAPAQEAPAPSTRPTGAAGPAFVGRLVANLHDVDPQIRAAARRAILGLEVDDLPRLADALRDRAGTDPESPAVALIVREAVSHLYLRRAKRQYHVLLDAGEIDDTYGRDGGFLGIKLPLNAANIPDDFGTNGVTVVDALAGFAAYEVLEAGDILVEIDTPRGRIPLGNPPALRQAVAGLPAGLDVEVRLVRGGEVLRLPFRLDRFVNTQRIEWLRLQAQARRDAQEAWQSRFAPLFDRPPQAGAAAP